jgi:hypothetical protein
MCLAAMRSQEVRQPLGRDRQRELDIHLKQRCTKNLLLLDPHRWYLLPTLSKPCVISCPATDPRASKLMESSAERSKSGGPTNLQERSSNSGTGCCSLQCDNVHHLTAGVGATTRSMITTGELPESKLLEQLEMKIGEHRSSAPSKRRLVPSRIVDVETAFTQHPSHRIAGSDPSFFLICRLPFRCNPHSIQHHDVPSNMVFNLVPAVAQNILPASSDIGCVR